MHLAISLTSLLLLWRLLVAAERPVLDYYEFRNEVAEGVQQALDACREQFKWERWNCPKKVFLDILQNAQLPATREVALVRALISSSISLTVIKKCTHDKNKKCTCHNGGCNEGLKLAKRVIETFLDDHGVNTSRQLSEYNFETGRQAVEKRIKLECDCNDPLSNCQECHTTLPNITELAEHLKIQYRKALKVGEKSAIDTNPVSLKYELDQLHHGRDLVFVDPSPDFCYENLQMGINGTLGRQCSKPKPEDKSSLSERNSCARLCTQCGYKVQTLRAKNVRQCDCRFVYCCAVECKRCETFVDNYRCARASS